MQPIDAYVVDMQIQVAPLKVYIQMVVYMCNTSPGQLQKMWK